MAARARAPATPPPPGPGPSRGPGRTDSGTPEGAGRDGKTQRFRPNPPTRRKTAPSRPPTRAWGRIFPRRYDGRSEPSFRWPRQSAREPRQPASGPKQRQSRKNAVSREPPGLGSTQGRANWGPKAHRKSPGSLRGNPAKTPFGRGPRIDVRAPDTTFSHGNPPFTPPRRPPGVPNLHAFLPYFGAPGARGLRVFPFIRKRTPRGTLGRPREAPGRPRVVLARPRPSPEEETPGKAERSRENSTSGAPGGPEACKNTWSWNSGNLPIRKNTALWAPRTPAGP